jgi:tRNA dimethylallyltransferase
MSSNPQIIVIGGPTGSGKTALSIDIAQILGTEIINADSRQVYEELNIGVAKPNPEELIAIKHHFVSNISIHQHYTAQHFAIEARKKIVEIIEKFGTVVVTGGTGLYLQALLYGLDDLPEISEELKVQLNNQLLERGLESLVDELLQLDQEAGENIDLKNPMRVMRALALVKTTHLPLKKIYPSSGEKQLVLPYRVEMFALDLPRKQLYERINLRVDNMISAGLAVEVESLIPHKNLKALNTVGYTEMFDFFDGNCTQLEAIEKIKQHSRNYAKRQVTWFGNKFEMQWLSPEKIKEKITQHYARNTN